MVAAAAAALTVACVGFAVHSDLTTPLVQEFGSSSAGAAIPGLALALPGALLMWRLGPHPIALVLAGFGVLWGLDGVAVGLVSQALASGATGRAGRRRREGPPRPPAHDGPALGNGDPSVAIMRR